MFLTENNSGSLRKLPGKWPRLSLVLGKLQICNFVSKRVNNEFPRSINILYNSLNKVITFTSPNIIYG